MRHTWRQHHHTDPSVLAPRPSLALDPESALQRSKLRHKLANALQRANKAVRGPSLRAISRRLFVQRTRAVAMSKAFGQFRREYPPPFACPECLRGFAFRSELTLHLWGGCGDEGKVWYLRSLVV